MQVMGVVGLGAVLADSPRELVSGGQQAQAMGTWLPPIPLQVVGLCCQQLDVGHNCQRHGHWSGCPVLQSHLLAVWAGNALREC